MFRKYFWLGLLLLISAWQIWPVLQRPNSAFAWGGDDGIITWQLNQTIEKIPGNLGKLFQGNIFYGYKNTAAFHMLLIPSAILSYIPTKLSGNPITAYNTSLIIAQFLTVTVMYFWLVELTKNKLAAFIGVLTFSFCQIRLYFDVHIHFWIMQWLVASAWMLWRYTQKYNIKWLYFAGLFFVIQVWESVYQAFWILIFAVILLTPHFNSLKHQTRHLVLMTLLVLLFTIPVLLVYLAIYRQFGSISSIRDAANFSMSLNDLWGKFLSPGLYFNLFIGFFCLSRLKLSKNSVPKWLWVVFFTGLVLALGPVLKWHDSTLKFVGKLFIPLPYSVLFYLIPGLSYLRSVHRYIWLMAFASAYISSLLFSLLKGKNRSLMAILMISMAILGGSTVIRTGNFPKPADYPAVYTWLKNQPGNVILELPTYNWADGEKHGLEMYRMVYSLKHNKYLLGGASGFLPPERDAFLTLITLYYPDSKLDTKLDQMGVNYVIYHKNEVTSEVYASFSARMKLPQIWEDKETSVYLVSSTNDQAI